MQITLKTKPKTKIMGWNQKRYEKNRILVAYDYRMGFVSGIREWKYIYRLSIDRNDFEMAKAIDLFCDSIGIDVKWEGKRKPELQKINLVG